VFSAEVGAVISANTTVLVRRRNPALPIASVYTSDGCLRTYNLHVAEVHCYAVGRIGVLVHNASPTKGTKAKCRCPQNPGPKPDCKRDPNKASNPCKLPSTAYCQAHHLIPCETWDSKVARLIHSCCFDLNGSTNLIMLPCCDYNGRMASYHRGRTPSEYIRKVNDFLQQLDGETDSTKLCQKAKQFIRNLKNELCNNKGRLNDESNIQKCRQGVNGNCSVSCS
jgi:hypothetical protein